jgi:AcrR family transcriptional regulator
VFARRGYEGASLDEIAETAGFTRGAIYKNFGGKEDLFLHVIDRGNEGVIEAFRSLVPDFPDAKEWDFSTLADLWRASVAGFDDLYVIGLEYELYVLRNPDARARAVEHRRSRRDLIASFIQEVAQRTGMTLRLPADELAAIILATADGLTYTLKVDGEDLFEPFLALLNAGMITD